MPPNYDTDNSETCREEWLQLALDQLENGGTIRGIAKEFGIPESTLRGRLKGAKSRKIVANNRYRLSRVQESFLIEWIHAEEAVGRPPTLDGVTRMQLRYFKKKVTVRGLFQRAR